MFLHSNFLCSLLIILPVSSTVGISKKNTRLQESVRPKMSANSMRPTECKGKSSLQGPPEVADVYRKKLCFLLDEPTPILWFLNGWCPDTYTLCSMDSTFMVQNPSIDEVCLVSLNVGIVKLLYRWQKRKVGWEEGAGKIEAYNFLLFHSSGWTQAIVNEERDWRLLLLMWRGKMFPYLSMLSNHLT